MPCAEYVKGTSCLEQQTVPFPSLLCICTETVPAAGQPLSSHQRRRTRCGRYSSSITLKEQRAEKHCYFNQFASSLTTDLTTGAAAGRTGRPVTEGRNSLSQAHFLFASVGKNPPHPHFSPGFGRDAGDAPSDHPSGRKFDHSSVAIPLYLLNDILKNTNLFAQKMAKCRLT